MWLIIGPFDVEVVGELNFQSESTFTVYLRSSRKLVFPETKLLKTNMTYPVGTKDRPLTLASKKVSHDHSLLWIRSYAFEIPLVCVIGEVVNMCRGILHQGQAFISTTRRTKGLRSTMETN